MALWWPRSGRVECVSDHAQGELGEKKPGAQEALKRNKQAKIRRSSILRHAKAIISINVFTKHNRAKELSHVMRCKAAVRSVDNFVNNCTRETYLNGLDEVSYYGEREIKGNLRMQAPVDNIRRSRVLLLVS